MVSPADVVAELSQAVDDPATMVRTAADWGEIQFVELQFPPRGCATVSPIGFYAISSQTGTHSFLSKEGVARAPRPLPRNVPLIHESGHGSRYAWAAAHEARMTCLDTRVVAQAAEEMGMVNPARVHIVSSYEGRRDPLLEHLIEALVAEARLGLHRAQPLIVESVATALASHLLERFNETAPRPLRVPGALAAAVLARVRAYIEDTLGQRISLSQLAAVAGVSRFHFARQFRASSGESAMAYLRRVRIERAKSVLCQRDITITELALSLGFADQSHFTRAFRRQVGIAPGEFARRAHGRRLQDDKRG
jgi:AraC family transcriptional regulator